MVTLVGQGLTLGPLINRLGIQDDGNDEREEIAARTRLAEAALERLEELRGEDWVRDDTVERVQRHVHLPPAALLGSAGR